MEIINADRSFESQGLKNLERMICMLRDILWDNIFEVGKKLNITAGILVNTEKD